jgi:hypothetical protein
MLPKLKEANWKDYGLKIAFMFVLTDTIGKPI